VKLTVIGCGDAFGSGGRLQSAYVLEHQGKSVLIDCGVTTLIGLERLKLSFDQFSSVVITHLHGDHFAGLVWCLMHASFVTHRRTPLAIYGPPGLEERMTATIDILYPHTAAKLSKLHVTYHVMNAGHGLDIEGMRVMAYDVRHPSGAPSHALRFEGHGKVFAFTGDSEWTDVLVSAGHGADLYLMECYRYEGKPVFHLCWHTIQSNLPRIEAKRVVLTHMANDMLARCNEINEPNVEFATDGAIFHI